MSEAGDTTGTKQREGNQVPVIARMLDLLEIIERRPAGASIRELSEFLDMPRSTVYRILNTLEARDVVKRGFSGAYLLGPRLLSLAANVVAGHDSDLAKLANTHLERLSQSTGEASKLSVLDGDGVLVIAVAHSAGAYGLTVKPGRRLPLHAGAASRVLLAHMDGGDIARILNGPLPRYTDTTMCEPEDIGRSLAQIRRTGFALDDGEFSVGVMAVASPIHDRQNKVVAALSIPFLRTQDRSRIDTLRAAVIDAAKLISQDFQNRLAQSGS